MAFSDPQSVTVNAVAKSMPRVETDGKKSVYQKSDGTFKLTISHTPTGNGRIRTMARIDQRAVVPDPLTAVNDYETLSFYVVIDRPEVGFSATEVGYLTAGLVAWLDSTAVGKLFGLES
jgi:hypothetical protein